MRLDPQPRRHTFVLHRVIRDTGGMDIQEARARFDRGMGHCDAIIKVHRQHGGGAQGFRTLEPSLNRAVVVLAVAAWQAALQDLTLSALDHAQPTGMHGVGALLRGHVASEISRFSTPNSDKSRALMKLVDYDPYPLWTWRQMGGQGVGVITVSPARAAQMTDSWLRLRHDIAHGHPTLSVVDVLESVREAIKTWLADHPAANHVDAINYLKTDASFHPSLRLVDADRCVTHFRRLARLTAQGLAATGLGPNVW